MQYLIDCSKECYVTFRCSILDMFKDNEELSEIKALLSLLRTKNIDSSNLSIYLDSNDKDLHHKLYAYIAFFKMGWCLGGEKALNKVMQRISV